MSESVSEVRLRAFVLGHIPHCGFSFYVNTTREERAVTDSCVKHVDRSGKRIIAAACVSNVLSSTQQAYLSRAQECELQQNCMWLTISECSS